MARPTKPAIQPATFYVEVRFLADGMSGAFGKFQETAKIRVEVEQLIRRNYSEVKIGTVVPVGRLVRYVEGLNSVRLLHGGHISQNTGLPLAKAIDRVEITGYSKSQTFPDETLYSLTKSTIEIFAYTLASEEDVQSQDGKDGDMDLPSLPYESISLPHQTFEGLWQTLIYQDPVGELTLRTLTRAIKEQKDHPKLCLTSSWQNTILFYGPPGSGKTTLALALAQRLSIRLSRVFQETKLLQINAHALFSRFYGETTKNIGQLFRHISKLATDPEQLVVIIFDEVETVVASREKASQSNEPVEAVRACGSPSLLYQSTNTESRLPTRCFVALISFACIRTSSSSSPVTLFPAWI